MKRAKLELEAAQTEAGSVSTELSKNQELLLGDYRSIRDTDGKYEPTS